MTTEDEFRLKAHTLILELDAATSAMMQLISARQTSGPEWDETIKRQHEAYERWVEYLNERS